MGEFIVTKVSELDLSSESIAGTMLKEDVVCKAARSLGLRVKKVHRRISMEEFNERWSNLRLCMFCGEEETPYHHLQHKNEVILMIECDDDQTFDDKEETHQVHETLTDPAPIEEDVSSDQICDEKELVSVNLDLQEVQTKTVAEEKLNLPNGQNIEHLVGKNFETFSTEYSSFLNLSSSNGYQKDSTWIESSLYLLCSLKDGRVWEPGGLPNKMDLWDWPETELKLYGESQQVRTFLYSLMQVVKRNLEFKTFESNKTFSFKDEQDDEPEQNQVIKLISSWTNRIWEPGGITLLSKMVCAFLLPFLTMNMDSRTICLTSRSIFVDDAANIALRRIVEDRFVPRMEEIYIESIKQNLEFATDRGWIEFWINAHVFTLTNSGSKLSSSEYTKHTLILVYHLCSLSSSRLFVKTYAGCIVALLMVYDAERLIQLDAPPIFSDLLCVMNRIRVRLKRVLLVEFLWLILFASKMFKSSNVHQNKNQVDQKLSSYWKLLLRLLHPLHINRWRSFYLLVIKSLFKGKEESVSFNVAVPSCSSYVKVLEPIKDKASKKRKLCKNWWFKYKLSTWLSEALHFWRKRKSEKLQRASKHMICELIHNSWDRSIFGKSRTWLLCKLRLVHGLEDLRQFTHAGIKFHLKHKWRSRLLQSFSELKQRITVSLWKSFGYLMVDMMGEDQKQQGDSELLVIVFECLDAKGGVGMDKKQSHLSLWINRVWDPGRSLVKDASYSTRIFSSLPATVPVSLHCYVKKHLPTFSTNLEVKVSLKGEDLLQVIWVTLGLRFGLSV